ncbi:sugar phosphate isomerase/epimerase family protein [Paenibacillus anseongense]|nr:TIM barrel protein [Paenibacillus anseongense]MEC0266956.1 sugar phosphate isomerase/epimerase [Paenibacillus anseongense]
MKLFKSLWGMEAYTYREAFGKIAAAGYSGVEAGVPMKEHRTEFGQLLQEYNLDYIALISTSGNHEETFKANLETAVSLDPTLVISHSARDCMSEERQLQFFEYAVEAEKHYGIPVGHETHRHRAMFTPWTTARLLQAIPDLKITADFSHWCCVCESLLEDQQENLQIAFERTIHIHARVGYAQGPQVPHPDAPEYKRELEAHELWWEHIWNARISKGFASTTITPEFGPPGYMHTMPFSNEPVSDLWEVCLRMADRLRNKFA